LQAAASLRPDEVNIHWRLARVYRALGKRDEAKAEFDRASKLTKSADDDLYHKIANSRQGPPPQTDPPAAPPNP